MSDIRKYVSDVRNAQASIQDAPPSDDQHMLEENMSAFINTTEGRFASFQAVLNAITDRITASPVSMAPAPLPPPHPQVLAPPVPAFQAVPPAAPVVQAFAPTATALQPVHAPSSAPVLNHVPAIAPFSQIGASSASAPAGNMTIDPGPFFTPNPTAQAQSVYSSAPFSQYPPASGPVRGQEENRFIRVWNISPGPWNARAFGRVLVEEATGVNIRDVTDYKRISSTALIITFKYVDDASHFLAAFTRPGRSLHFQRLKAEGVGDPHRFNDRPTMDDICGPTTPGFSAVPVPSAGYDNYPRP